MRESVQAHMVDITRKPVTQREAIAKGMVSMQPSTLEAIKEGRVEKGDVLAIAQLAGIMGAKQTPHLLPLCHPLLIDEVRVELNLDEEKPGVEITAAIKGKGRTGMEMEALTAVAISALCIYDLCKPMDPGLQIEKIRLTKKSGGKSGTVVLD